ncbi:hypothetical protein [Maricaulis sp.]|uniref:hypothetical protein n=1 Tax=Maricaulis sp. TaxID=1486257 RepID=UPI00261876B7|nr:hypothetical protein [Maricaulis sp.]
MLLRHALAALTVSFSLSAGFWLVWGVFVMPGFVVMSLAAAAAGLLAGWLAGKRLWVTILATAVFRLVIYLVATAA